MNHKKKLMILLLSIVLLFLGCSQIGSVFNMFGTPLKLQSQTSETAISSSLKGNERSLETTDSKVYFRSSDIEFWSVDSIEGISDIVSAKYFRFGNNSIEMNLPDEEETIVFIPEESNVFDAGNINFNTSSRYNIIRIDIGGGYISFIENRREINPQNTITGEESSINANSIVLIDSAYLSTPVYISRDTYQDMKDNNYDWNEGDILAIDQPLVKALYPIMGATIVDMDGGLLIPFDPIDFGDYEAVSSVTIDFVWDMTDAVYESDGEWFYTDRVLGTPFDFQVKLIVE